MCVCVHPWFLPPAAHAQANAAQEVAVNLAEGRVIVCAAKDGIIVATADTHSERGSHQPVVVALSALRAGVLLGAVEWIQPESSDKPIRLDSELERIAAGAVSVTATAASFRRKTAAPFQWPAIGEIRRGGTWS